MTKVRITVVFINFKFYREDIEDFNRYKKIIYFSYIYVYLYIICMAIGHFKQFKVLP